MININSYLSTLVILENFEIIKDFYSKKSTEYSKQDFIRKLVTHVSNIINDATYLDLEKDHYIFKNLENLILKTCIKISDNKLTLVNKKIDLVSNEVLDTITSPCHCDEPIDIENTSYNTNIVVKIDNPYFKKKSEIIEVGRKVYCVRRSNRIKKTPNYYGFA